MAIQLRRDSAADWTSNNPTLAAGQPGFEEDTGKLKIGDGATAWTSLAYIPGSFYTRATSSGAAYIDFYEDTDNGTNRVRFQGPASTADVTVTLPSTAGTVALTSQLVGKQTIWIPASAMIAATTNGPATAQLETTTNKQNYSVLDFDGAGTTSELAHFQIAMPKGWDEGTVTYQVYWSSTATDTDGVVWGLQAGSYSDNEAIDAAWGTGVTVTDACQSAAGEVYVSSESSAVTIAGSPAEGDLCFFRFYREPNNGSDTAVEDARLIGIKLFYTTNALTDD